MFITPPVAVPPPASCSVPSVTLSVPVLLKTMPDCRNEVVPVPVLLKLPLFVKVAAAPAKCPMSASSVTLNAPLFVKTAPGSRRSVLPLRLVVRSLTSVRAPRDLEPAPLTVSN